MLFNRIKIVIQFIEIIFIFLYKIVMPFKYLIRKPFILELLLCISKLLLYLNIECFNLRFLAFEFVLFSVCIGSGVYEDLFNILKCLLKLLFWFLWCCLC